jgi:hypothetical protein
MPLRAVLSERFQFLVVALSTFDLTFFRQIHRPHPVGVEIILIRNVVIENL